MDILQKSMGGYDGMYGGFGYEDRNNGGIFC